MAFTVDTYKSQLYNTLKDIKKPHNYVTKKIRKINDEDIKRGWIYRYFFRQINNINSEIIETDEQEYDEFISNTFYENIKIKWKITGEMLNISDINLNILIDADKKFKGIKKELENKLLKYESNDLL